MLTVIRPLAVKPARADAIPKTLTTTPCLTCVSLWHLPQACAPGDKSRQTRDNRDTVVAFGTDLPSRRSCMLLRMLLHELRAALHHATPSWQSTSPTGRAIR